MALQSDLGTLSILVTVTMTVDIVFCTELHHKNKLESELERELLNELCPAVDICNSNATTATLRPNGAVWRDWISCCTGCSCHRECGEMPNCCFPDQNNRTDDTTPAIYECHRTRIGQPEEDTPMIEPGYWTVMKAPQSGCVDNKPINIGPDQLVYPTCDDDDDVPLMMASTPVYSTDTDKIYKNILCARCHGVTSMTSFRAFLVFKRKRSLAEQMTVLETGKLCRYCYLDHVYNDWSVISSKKCYPDVVKTCETNAMADYSTDIDFNRVGFETIKSLCEMGVYAPTPSEDKMYRNVFCAICGLRGRDAQYCSPEENFKTDFKALIHFLDNNELFRKVQESQGTVVSKVCLSSTFKIKKRCRRTHCPSGQVRQTSGGCVFVSKSMLGGKGTIQLKLTPIEPMDSILNAYVNIDIGLIKAAMKVGHPWPKDWQVMGTQKRLDKSQCAEKGEFIVELMAVSESLKNSYQDITASIHKPWVIEINESSFRYKQSFQDYTIGSIPIPLWQTQHRYLNRTDRYFGCEAIEWSRNVQPFSTIPVQLDKLFLCVQVELNPGEFRLALENAFLESNITIRVLYDKEFDLIMKDEYHARVCVHDTIFSRQITNAGIQYPSRMLLLLGALWIVHVFL